MTPQNTPTAEKHDTPCSTYTGAIGSRQVAHKLPLTILVRQIINMPAAKNIKNAIIPQRIKCYQIIPDNARRPCDQFNKKLKKKGWVVVPSTKQKSKAVIVYCAAVSRLGTDVSAALQQLEEDDLRGTPTVLVVLHHTFDPDYTVPDSSRSVTRENTTTVDCLFHEDQGLLKCATNKEAKKKVVKWLEEEKKKRKEKKKQQAENPANRERKSKEKGKTKPEDGQAAEVGSA
ncbi:uncharacterized protein LOC143518426 isoform X2 [Brachyhypopomus gauderio]|uniref:uncharacterized protein LOC143518426 isoform X2 n=1 Tax=Brachyhypopomus gauderio TaxID=698409 RepID=UPI0040419A81